MERIWKNISLQIASNMSGPSFRTGPSREETPRETQTVTATNQRTASTREIVEGHLKERARKATRRKWGGEDW